MLRWVLGGLEEWSDGASLGEVCVHIDVASRVYSLATCKEYF